MHLLSSRYFQTGRLRPLSTRRFVRPRRTGSAGRKLVPRAPALSPWNLVLVFCFDCGRPPSLDLLACCYQDRYMHNHVPVQTTSPSAENCQFRRFTSTRKNGRRGLNFSDSNSKHNARGIRETNSTPGALPPPISPIYFSSKKWSQRVFFFWGQSLNIMLEESEKQFFLNSSKKISTSIFFKKISDFFEKNWKIKNFI